MRASVHALTTTAQSPAVRYLGPATVRATGRNVFEVELTTGVVVDAVLALAFPYEPAVDDRLLVIGEADEHWIIGVIEGRGSSRMAIQGDVSLRAVGGALELVGDEGVRVGGPTVEVETGTFTLLAREAVQKLSRLRQRVRDLVTLEAREAHTIIEETALHRAKKHAVVAEETASVNGKQILLG